MNTSLPMTTRTVRKVLPMSISQPIPPGASGIVVATPQELFRAERVLVSPSSFPLPWYRLAWTWPAITTGTWIGRAHRVIARWLRVDLHASHERREYIDEPTEAEIAAAEPRDERLDVAHDDGDGDGGVTEIFTEFDGEQDRYYRIVEIPLSRRERFLRPIGRLAGRLSRVRTSWQMRHLAMVSITNVKISAVPIVAPGNALPADMFAGATDALVSFEPCKAGSKIEVEVANGSPRACQVVMSLIGTAAGRT